MKALLLSLISFALSTVIIAQAYIPIANSGALWRVEERSIGCSEKQYETVGDTIIDSLSYIKIHKILNNGFDGRSGCITHQNSFTGLAGMIRNDTANKRVYIILPGESSEKLLYDFDLKIGDTLTDTYLLDATGSELTVDTIITRNITGQNRKVFEINIRNAYGASRPLSLIEGIGSTYGFMDTILFGYIFPKLTCFKQDGHVVYPDSSTLCNLITGINETTNQIVKSTIDLYPNPIQDKLNISIEQGRSIQSIRLYDLMGREQSVKIEKRSMSNYLLELRTMPRGIYIIDLEMKDGIRVSKKVLKQ